MRAVLCPQVVDKGAVQALLRMLDGSHLMSARISAVRTLARLIRDRRAAAVLMALEGHKVSVSVCVCAYVCVHVYMHACNHKDLCSVVCVCALGHARYMRTWP